MENDFGIEKLGESGRVEPERKPKMDDVLRGLMQQLGQAINDTLSDSDRIAEAVGEMKRAGYDVFLVLEAAIGFNKRDSEDESKDGERVDNTDNPNPASSKKFKFTKSDRRFLRGLNIGLDKD